MYNSFVDIVLKDISDVSCFLPQSILIGAVLTIIYCVIVFGIMNINKKQKSCIHALSVFFLLTYVIIILEIAIFSREPGSRNGICMRLFGTWGDNEQMQAYVIENILLFIPFGFLFPLAFNRLRRRYTILTALVMSVFIEVVQLIAKCGFCQLDDVVMNVLGSGVGLSVYIIMNRITYK